MASEARLGFTVKSLRFKLPFKTRRARAKTKSQSLRKPDERGLRLRPGLANVVNEVVEKARHGCVVEMDNGLCNVNHGTSDANVRNQRCIEIDWRANEEMPVDIMLTRGMIGRANI